MKVLCNEPMDMSCICGGVVLTYYAKDEILLQNTFEKFNDFGVSIYKNPLDETTINRGNYSTEIQDVISSSCCYVVFLTKGLFDCKPAKMTLMYQMGFAEESVKLSKLNPKFDDTNKVAFINCEKDLSPKEMLFDSPYNDTEHIDCIDSVDGLIENLCKKFILEKNVFYTDKEMNRLVSKRMKYHLIKTKFDVPLELIKETGFPLNDNSFKKILSYFEAGIKICMFGYDKEDIQSCIYNDEYEIDEDYKIFPSRKDNLRLKKSYISQVKNDTIVSLSFIFEYFIPIHRPLGTSYKAFIESKTEAYVFLKKMMQSNFNFDDGIIHDVYESDEEKRIYFCFDFAVGNDFSHGNIKDALQKWNVGEKVDFCYPE